MATETTPLLQPPSPSNFWDFGDNRNDDLHTQFCKLVGIPPIERLMDLGQKAIPYKSLYGRASRLLSSQTKVYLFTAALTNTLLLSQVILGAALTALGASSSSHIIITYCRAANTIIAGLVAYLKSRGQPVRARMFRDDLERVIDEIEDSETMWRGVSMGIHGYDDIEEDEQITIRTEIARLTRLYERAVRTNAMNTPDQYQNEGIGNKQGTLKRGRTMSLMPPYAQPPRDVLRLTMNDPDRSPAVAPSITINAPDFQAQSAQDNATAIKQSGSIDPKQISLLTGKMADRSPITDVPSHHNKHKDKGHSSDP